MTKLIIIRHGESEANKLGVIAGWNDYPLTELGVKQAEETAAHLVATERIDVVCSSDLCRAEATAKACADKLGLAVQTYPELRETFCGDWEGETFADVEARDREAYENFRRFQLLHTFINGENLWESGERFYKKVLEIAKENEGKTIVLAAHGAVIRVFWALICGTPKEEATAKHDYASNASYSTVEFDGEGFIPVEYSHDSHLSVATHLHI
jgi:broad specificity phosphatase PhoE